VVEEGHRCSGAAMETLTRGGLGSVEATRVQR
jgi:hypothetical protein